MRIERRGPVVALTPRVERFLAEALGGVSLDRPEQIHELRPDFSCLRGLLAVELKTLKEPGTERLDNLTDELRKRDDWPIFLGSAPMESFLANTNDPDGLRRRVTERVGRAIINHLKKANRQLGAHTASVDRSNLVRLLILVNEDRELYDPHTVAYILWHAVRRRDGVRPLYEHVDGILYMTERHAAVAEGKIAFPIVTIEAGGVSTHPWKGEAIAFVAERWAKWNGGSSLASGVAADAFSTIDHIPDIARRQEWWEIEYRRNPYLGSLSFEQLRDRFDEVTLVSLLYSLKDSPVPMSWEANIENIKQFSHFMLEMADRAIPMTAFPHESGRAIAAAHRLRLPTHVIEWLIEFEREMEGRSQKAS